MRITILSLGGRNVAGDTVKNRDSQRYFAGVANALTRMQVGGVDGTKIQNGAPDATGAVLCAHVIFIMERGTSSSADERQDPGDKT